MVAQRLQLIGVRDVEAEDHRRQHERAEHRRALGARRAQDEGARGEQRGEYQWDRSVHVRCMRSVICGLPAASIDGSSGSGNR
jgi:hypothetical protein